MGFRFQRSLKILPGVRLNLSKSGLGISAGPRGLKVGVDARGRKYVSAGIPGTGISSRQYLKSGSTASSSALVPAAECLDVGESARSSSNKPYWIVGACLLAAIGLVVAVTSRDQPVIARDEPRWTDPTPPATEAAEQGAVAIARAALLRAHPAYVPGRITSDGTPAAVRTPAGFDVKLQYRTGAGSVRRYLCKVAGLVGTCAARTAATPAPAPTPRAGPALHVGPRGGIYHYSRSGRKVYERRHR